METVRTITATAYLKYRIREMVAENRGKTTDNLGALAQKASEELAEGTKNPEFYDPMPSLAQYLFNAFSKEQAVKLKHDLSEELNLKHEMSEKRKRGESDSAQRSVSPEILGVPAAVETVTLASPRHNQVKENLAWSAARFLQDELDTGTPHQAAVGPYKTASEIEQQAVLAEESPESTQDDSDKDQTFEPPAARGSGRGCNHSAWGGHGRNPPGGGRSGKGQGSGKGKRK
ncbi:hypothetical protein FOMPIDRAFT_1048007 [Fomitopsis schrenkii]|uniref:Uncharacterized protein n=1 Tax=Fomitopsis schrenkii TaxID=2126942 RepID=S8ECI1_FOMSC|nr:hypothetical protein FOMPIDRAFT_1048007 [Fomitopsis schrenkii]